jgi:hypothetical protein
MIIEFSLDVYLFNFSLVLKIFIKFIYKNQLTILLDINIYELNFNQFFVNFY